MRTALARSMALAGVFLAIGAKAQTAAEESARESRERANVRRIYDRVQARQDPRAARKASPYTVTIPNTTVAYEMVPIPAGEFAMGSAVSDPQRKKDEQPQHKVRVDAFWMQAHEVTWDEYRLFMFASQAGDIAHKDESVDGVSRPTRPYVEMSFGMGIDGYPAISMTQHAANKYAEWLSAKTGEFYRLPTEAEWEYACRAGTNTAHYSGDSEKDLDRVAWHSGNSKKTTHPVGQKEPNAFELYDMHGNVWQWCQDWWEHDYSKSSSENPQGPSHGTQRVLRGGAWDIKPIGC